MAGAAATLALPPLNIWPAPFLAFPVLVWLIDGTGSGRRTMPTTRSPSANPEPEGADSTRPSDS